MQSAPKNQQAARWSRHQRGFVLVWIALLMTTLLGTAALAIEWNNWNRVGSQMQKAADAAALGGVVYWTSDQTRARSTAEDLAGQNGFETANGDTIEVWAGERPGVMGVTITRQVDNVLGSVFGIRGRTITRSATAEFSAPLEMGSPEAAFGADPDREILDPTYVDPNFWASVGGPVQPKNAGEPYMTTWCNFPPGFFGSTNTDNCLPTQIGGENLDVDQRGYFYEIRVENPGQPLHVEIFDPANVSGSCAANNTGIYPGQLNAEGVALFPNYGNPPVPGNYDNSAPLSIPLSGTGPAPGVSGQDWEDYIRAVVDPSYTLPAGVPRGVWRWGTALNWAAGPQMNALWLANQIPGYPSTEPIPPSVRYAPGNTGPFCTADDFYSDPYPPVNKWTPYGWGTDAYFTGPAEPPISTWRLWRADPGSHDPMAGTVVCEAEFAGYRGHIPNALLRPEQTSLVSSPQHAAGIHFAEYFRNWFPICGDGGVPGAAGRYFLQVTTAEHLDGSPAPPTAGHNRYSVRAGMGSPTNQTGVSLAGYGRMQTATLTPGSVGTFYLTRLEPTDTNRTLTLRFWDIGDSAEGNPGIITVLPPEDATGLDLGPAGTCRYSDPLGRWTFISPPQTRPMIPAQADCSIHGVNINPFDAKWIVMTVPIPDTYRCNNTPAPGEEPGCWFKLKFDYPAGIGDTAVWEASIDGDPVRLVG